MQLVRLAPPPQPKEGAIVADDAIEVGVADGDGGAGWFHTYLFPAPLLRISGSDSDVTKGSDAFFGGGADATSTS